MMEPPSSLSSGRMREWHTQSAMTSQLNRIAGPAAKPLRLGLAAFAIALVGVIIALSMDYGPHNHWSFIVFSIVAFGVGLGFVAVLWGWVATARHYAKRRTKESPR